MAETVVSVVVERLSDLLIQKVVFLKGVRGQVGKLQNQLVDMKCFLKDAEERQDDNESIRNWISQIRLAAYDAEDVIDTFIIKIETLGRKRFVQKLAYFPKRLLCLNKVGKDIESIQARIRDIAESREIFDIKKLAVGEGSSSSIRGEEQQRLRRTSPLSQDKDIVGLEDKTRSLVAELLKEGRRSRVVSIIGMGGVGKTTLARKLYNHPDVRAQFDHCAWVCISDQSFDYKGTLGSVIKQINTPTKDLLEMLEKMQEEDLEKKLHQELENKRYLVVLDDIWKEETWDCIARAFPEGGNGSRFLLTSRNQDVPLHADNRSIPYELKSLGQEDSWELFVKKACGDSDNPTCPSELEGIGRDIARRCAGLPLAITVIGSLLGRKKKQKGDWERVLNNISMHLSKKQTGVSAILALSYSDLPPHLKSCFLYFGFFPEDYEILSRKLIHIWIAEGLVQPNDAEILEEVAEDYLDELISRNMVQVVSLSADEKVKSCRVHDLLRDLAITKAEEEMFLEIHGSRDTRTSANCRHCAVHSHAENYNFSTHSAPHLRSLLFFNLSKSKAKVSLNFKSLELLRVLDQQNMEVETLPTEIGNVRLLRYLGLRSTMVKKLPESVGQLKCLQTLDIATLSIIEVPNFIWKLENLRHLYMNTISCSEPLRIDTLRNIQTISSIHVDHILHNNLISLTNLQKLGVIVDTEEQAENLCNSIAKLESLRSLCLILGAGFSTFTGLSKLSQVTKLKIKGKLRIIPFQLPANLSQLSLKGTHLEEDPMPILEKLKDLSLLKLQEAYSGKEMVISENGFPKLKFFRLDNLLYLEEIIVGKGGMAELRCLNIIRCHNLKMLPEEVKNMTALEKVEGKDVQRDFIDRLRTVDAYKVCHVPVVILNAYSGFRVGMTVYALALKFLDASK